MFHVHEHFIFDSAANNQGTGVYAICSFNNTSAAENVDRVIVHRQFSYTTRNITKLGQYLLDPNSLYVNGTNCIIISHSTAEFITKPDQQLVFTQSVFCFCNVIFKVKSLENSFPIGNLVLHFFLLIL